MDQRFQPPHFQIRFVGGVGEVYEFC